MTVRVEGERELRASLKAAGVKMTEVSKINREAAAIVVPVAAGLAPHRTGRLAKSIRAGATQRHGIVRAGSKALPYAGPIHWGWPARGIVGRPFMSIAAQVTEPRWLPLYEKHIAQLADSVKGA